LTGGELDLLLVVTLAATTSGASGTIVIVNLSAIGKFTPATLASSS
jgi:hypothetical protein